MYIEFDDDGGTLNIMEHVKAHDKLKSISAAFSKLMQQHIMPLIKKTSVSRLVKDALGHGDTCIVVYDCLPTLSDIFSSYGG